MSDAPAPGWYAYVLVSYGAAAPAPRPVGKVAKRRRSREPAVGKATGGKALAGKSVIADAVSRSASASPVSMKIPRRRVALGRVLRTYVGVAVDVERRARQHNGELAGGARSTRAGRPWHIAIVHGPYPDRGTAQSVEHQLKQRRGAAARLQPLALARPPSARASSSARR